MLTFYNSSMYFDRICEYPDFSLIFKIFFPIRCFFRSRVTVDLHSRCECFLSIFEKCSWVGGDTRVRNVGPAVLRRGTVTSVKRENSGMRKRHVTIVTAGGIQSRVARVTSSPAEAATFISQPTERRAQQ